MKKNNQKNKGFTQHLIFSSKKEGAGFTLLYASMIAGLLLAIGAAILSITVKQISLSAAGRESQFAFYNADTGTECALYLYRASKLWSPDVCPAGLFPAKGDTSNADPSCVNLPSQAQCLGLLISSFKNDSNGTYGFSIDNISNKNVNNVCFDVTVDRSVSGVNIITSKGYNTCSDVNRFERAIEVKF
ncbi:MAG: hypothetical protein WCF92_01155 [bacterium]